jgi:hypothetical protein
MNIALTYNSTNNSITIRVESRNHLPKWIWNNNDFSPKFSRIDNPSQSIELFCVEQMEKFIALFEKNDKYNDKGNIELPLLTTGICIQSPQHLAKLFTEIKDTATIDDEGTIKIDPEHFNSIQENDKKFTHTLSLKQKFLDVHTKLYNESKKGFFGYFRNTNLKKESSLEEIIHYARDNNNRSRQACIKLGWMKKDGSLNTNNPDLPEKIRQAYSSDQHNSVAP